MYPGKLLDTTMSKTAPLGQYTSKNITDDIAEQLIEAHPGYTKFFKKYPGSHPSPVQTNGANLTRYKSPLTCAVIIPTRGDRNKFLDHAIEMINGQTVKPEDVVIVDFEPDGDVLDLTERYRKGYEMAKGYDVVIPWEDDDYYQPTYLETVLKLWEQHPELELIGAKHTTYYHIFNKKYKVIPTKAHSSMMNTSIKGGLDIDWPADNTVFLDLLLWGSMKGKLFDFGDQCVGIKHGVGVCGGRGHSSNLCDVADPDGRYLRQLTDQESFEFYTTYEQ